MGYHSIYRRSEANLHLDELALTFAPERSPQALVHLGNNALVVRGAKLCDEFTVVQCALMAVLQELAFSYNPFHSFILRLFEVKS